MDRRTSNNNINCNVSSRWESSEAIILKTPCEKATNTGVLIFLSKIGRSGGGRTQWWRAHDEKHCCFVVDYLPHPSSIAAFQQQTNKQLSCRPVHPQLYNIGSCHWCPPSTISCYPWWYETHNHLQAKQTDTTADTTEERIKVMTAVWDMGIPTLCRG